MAGINRAAVHNALEVEAHQQGDAEEVEKLSVSNASQAGRVGDYIYKTDYTCFPKLINEG